LVFGGVIAAAVLGGAYITARVVYLGPRGEIAPASAAATNEIDGYLDALGRMPRPAEIRRTLGETTLANSPEEVSHWFRTLLSELGDTNGLREVVVTHGTPSRVQSPAADRSSGLGASVRRAIDDTPTFAVLSGRVTGAGSFDAVLETVAALQSQPWIHRFEGFQIEPSNRARTAFVLRADVTTAFQAGLRRKSTPDPRVAPTDDAARQTAARIAATNFFVVPPPPAKPAPEPPTPEPVKRPRAEPDPAPPPPPPAYDAWTVVGVIETAGSLSPVEVLVRHSGGEGSRTLVPGDVLFGAELVRTEPGGAVFRINGTTWRVEIGALISERREAVPPASGEADEG
ncbi:MAG: hypothetical protein AAF235_02490, partial [Planctomycetota bacterium]